MKNDLSINECSMVILAGGFGTRIKHLIGETPKPMYQVLGRPFLEWLVRFYASQGIRRFVISTGYKADIIQQHFNQLSVSNTTILCVREESPLGTAGGFVNAVRKSMLGSPAWFVANGDSICIDKVQGMIDTVGQTSCDLAVLGLHCNDATRFGTLECDHDGRLVRFAEKRPGIGIINAGLYLLKSDLIKVFPVNRPLGFENDVFPVLLSMDAQISVVKSEGNFIDIGVEQTLRETETFIRENLLENY
jgi:D-glycero-alpha-D-manno-heptose 1-phosphate guanylyltransferase